MKVGTGPRDGPRFGVPRIVLLEAMIEVGRFKVFI